MGSNAPAYFHLSPTRQTGTSAATGELFSLADSVITSCKNSVVELYDNGDVTEMSIIRTSDNDFISPRDMLRMVWAAHHRK